MTGCQQQSVPLAGALSALELAKRMLDRFCVVMIQEEMEESAQLLSHYLTQFRGWNASSIQLASLPHVNQNAQRHNGHYVVPRNSNLYHRLAQINDLDMQLYHYAVNRFKTDWAALHT